MLGFHYVGYGCFLSSDSHCLVRIERMALERLGREVSGLNVWLIVPVSYRQQLANSLRRFALSILLAQLVMHLSCFACERKYAFCVLNIALVRFI